MTTEIIYHDIFSKHQMGMGHPESPLRVQAALKSLRDSRTLQIGNIRVVKPSAAGLDEITPLHDRSYLDRIRLVSESGGGYFTLDTMANEYTYDAALIAAGGGIIAVDHILDRECENAFVLCRPPGHHAEYSRAFGFCFINNIAVAAHHLINRRGLSRVMIVDYDAHHGNGTQSAFYSSSQVLYIGMHQDGRTLFPGTGFVDESGIGEGEGYTVNVPMHPNAGDKSYALVFDEVVESVAEKFHPEFILVSAGFDGYYRDPLTSLGLTQEGFAMMNERLLKMAEKCAYGRIAFFLEGGYNLDAMAACSKMLVEQLAGEEPIPEEEHNREQEIIVEKTGRVVEQVHSEFKGVYF